MPERLPPAKDWKNRVFARLSDSKPQTINVNEPLSGLWYSNGFQWYKVIISSNDTLEEVRAANNQIQGNIDFNLHTGINVRDPATALEIANKQYVDNAVATISHADLLNLTADDHPQYLLLDGRSGGQVVYGGTASGNDITISGTSHATPGDVIVNPAGGSLLVGLSSGNGFVHEIAGAAAANVAALGMFSSGLSNNQRIYWAMGKSPASSNAFSWLYNHNSTDSSRYLALSSYEGSTGIFTIFASGAANYGTVTLGGTTQGDRLTVLCNATTQPYAIRFGLAGTHHWRFGIGPDGGTRYMKLYSGVSAADILSIDRDGRIGWIIGGMTAMLHLKAGTTAANTAPLKFTSGSLNTAAEAGAMEFLTDDLHFTITTGTARKRIVIEDTTLVSGRIPFATTNGRVTDSSDLTFGSQTLTTYKAVVTNLFETQAGHKFKRTAINDADHTILSTDHLIAWTAITAGRSATLPSAASVVGQEFVVKDESGNAGTNNITITGTVDGAVDPVINTNYGFLRIYSDGSNFFSF